VYKRQVPTTSDQAVYAFLRSNGSKRIFVMLNLSSAEQSIQVKGNDFAGNYREIFLGETKNWVYDEKVTLKPWEYRVYVSE
jgi:hypothetical protein